MNPCREEIFEKEIMSTLAAFQKGKILGSDGLMVEFFLGFFELLKFDLVKVVNESQEKGKCGTPSMRLFWLLFLKRKTLTLLWIFTMISYCNLIYKLIAKIIASRLKPIFSSYISEEQFGFLDERQIHDVVSITQEVLHSMKAKKRPGFIMKLDLEKAYDKVN
jgi:hypothetical protein